MQPNAEDLLNQISRDWPTEYELSRLRLLTDVQAAEIQRLTALLPPSTYGAGTPRPYALPIDGEESRHG